MKNVFLFSLSLILIMLVFSTGFAQEKITASFEISENKIFVYYELLGDSDKEYEVKVLLKRTSNPSFEMTPEELAGDVGKGKFAGKKRTIVWQLNDSERNKLEGDDFYFEVSARNIKSGGIPWYYYVGGALVGGGAAAILTLGGKDKDKSNGTELPKPPERPVGN